MYMWFDFQFKKRVFIFLSLLSSFLISWIIISPEVGKSIVNFGSRLNSTVETFLAGITVKKTVTDKVLTNSLSTIDFVAVSPKIDTILPTKSLFLRSITVQPSIKPSKIPVISLTRPPARQTPTRSPSPSPTNIPIPTKISPRSPSPTKSLAPRATAIPTPKVVSYRNPLGLPPPSSKIHDLAVEIGEKVGVPPALILTFMHIETGDRFYNGDNIFIEKYSKPGASLLFNYFKLMPDSCLLNSCSAAGPMQMTIGYDSYNDTTCSRCDYNINNNKLGCGNAWNRVVGQVKSLIGSSSVSPCNIKENIYGAAINIKNISNQYQGDADCTRGYQSREIQNMLPIENGMKWNIKAVYLAGCHYYGDCVTKNSNSGNKNYCQYLWDSLPPEHKIL